MLLLLAIATALADSPAEPVDDDIVVEGHSGFDPGRTAGTVSVVEVDEKLPMSMDVAGAVETTSGAVVRRLGGLGDFSAVSLRGSSLRQVQVHLDGVPLNPDGASVVNLSELPLFAFERVEVWRGFAPPSLTASAVGGVVNLVTGERTTPMSIQASYGSYDTVRLTATGGFEAQLGQIPTDGMVVVEGFATQGDFTYFDDNATLYNVWDDRFATRGNNDKSQLTAHARWRLGGPRLQLTVLDAFLAREEGLPGPMVNPAEESRLDTKRNLLTVQGNGGDERWCWTSRLHWLARTETLSDPEGEIGVLSTGVLASHTHNVGLTLDASWVANPWLIPELTAVVRHDRYSAEDVETGETSADNVRWSGVVAASADILLGADRLELMPVLQLTWLDNHALGSVPFEDEVIGVDSDSTLTSIDPRLAVVGRPASWVTLKANAGHYLRPPDFTELFGDRGVVIGNPELLPEQGWQWDIGARLTAPREWAVTGAVEVGGFWALTEDTIVMVQNSQRTMKPRNLDGAFVQGIEASLTLDVLGFLDSQTNLTRTWSRQNSEDDTIDGNQVPRLPPVQLWQSTALHWEETVRVGHTWTYLSPNYWDRTNWYASTPRSVHGLFVRVQPHADWPSLELDVLNLTDTTTEVVPRNPLDETDDAFVVQSMTDFTAYPLPGRTFLVTLRWEA